MNNSECIPATQPSLSVGDKVTVEIHDIAFGGEGVGRWQEFVVFVPFVATGEMVEATVVEVKKRFARARLAKVLRASPNRVVPECPYFGTCGGCQYQHLDYPTQVRIKHKQVVDLFQRIGGISASDIAEVIPCPKPYHYRNRIMIRSQWDKFKQGLNIGFLKAEDRLVVDVEECRIAEPGLNEAIRQVRANPPPKGGIKVTLRVPPEGWELPRDSFFQNNFHLLPKLVEAVRTRFQEAGSRYLVDLFCGVGFFSIELADLAVAFAGIELDRPAVLAARKNLARRGITNGDYISGAVEQTLASVLGRFPASETTMLLDPPRTGCLKETVELLLKERPRQIIYVSCHPATLARDLALFLEGGAYRLATVIPLDMFPQTQHLECVADLRAS